MIKFRVHGEQTVDLTGFYVGGVDDELDSDVS